MTVPTERTRAVIKLGEAVTELVPLINRRGDYVRVEKETIRNLVRWLRHYPTVGDMAMSADYLPEIWGEP